MSEIEDTGAEKVNKSIVPNRYGAKYRNGGSDELAEFIKATCTDESGFSYVSFFQLCLDNGIADDKVDMYRNQIAEKRHGAPGRARMTLRNMLAKIARDKGGLVNHKGELVAVNVPKPVLAGAAAKAKEEVA
jgi:hypothetical protein